MAATAEEIERARAHVDIQHKFERLHELTDGAGDGIVNSPEFYVRNLPFQLSLCWGRWGGVPHDVDNGIGLRCTLDCKSKLKKL